MNKRDQPAFPCEVECRDGTFHYTTRHTGLTLRQYYIGQALAGAAQDRSVSGKLVSAKVLARRAADIADAAIEEEL